MLRSRSLLALLLLTAPLLTAAAQRPAPDPTPKACADCAQVDLLRSKEQQLHAEMERLYDLALDAQQTLREQDDSASRVAYQQAVSDYNASRAAYSETVRQLMRVETQRASRELQRQMEKLSQSMRKEPKGWFGIYFSGEARTSFDSTGHETTLWAQYPIIESVEPESPAEKAGIESRDVLIAIDGGDVTKVPVSFSDILIPGRHVTMKVRHGRTTVDRMIVVEKRPSTAWSSGGGYSAPIAPPAIETPSVPGDAPEAPAPPDGPVLWRTPLPPRVIVGPIGPNDVAVSVTYDDMTVAGARVQRFSALKEYFGVDSGVLVLSVLPGTPAARAGLIDGDVIVRAGGRAVTDPGHLSRAIERASGTISLEIVRKHKKQQIVLKW